MSWFQWCLEFRLVLLSGALLCVLLFLLVALIGQLRWTQSSDFKAWMKTPMDTPQPSLLEHFKRALGLRK